MKTTYKKRIALLAILCSAALPTMMFGFSQNFYGAGGWHLVATSTASFVSDVDSTPGSGAVAFVVNLQNGTYLYNINSNNGMPPGIHASGSGPAGGYQLEHIVSNQGGGSAHASTWVSW